MYLICNKRGEEGWEAVVVEEKLVISYLRWQKLSVWSVGGGWVGSQCCCMAMSYPGVCPQEVERVACKLSQIRLSCLC